MSLIVDMLRCVTVRFLTMNIRSAPHLGDLVRARRLELDWSQSRLAAEAGVSRQWVGAMEAGKATVELGSVLRTIRELGLTFDLVPLPPPPIDMDKVLDG